MIIMEFIKKETDCVQHLNTKGCCFLCLETEEETTEAIPHFVSIRYLLRHLQITSFEKEIFNEKDIKVDLCETCENIFRGFTKVMAELEIVQIKMNHFLEGINKAISGSKKDIKKVQVYSKRMTDDPEALAQLAFVDKLRKKLAVKSLAMQVGAVPRIILERTEVKKKIQIKEEIDISREEFNEIAGANDVFDNDDQEASDHSDISQSLEPVFKPIKQEEEAGGSEVEAREPCNSQSVFYIKIKDTGMFKCKKCTKTCRSKAGILHHHRSIHRKIKYKCEICNISTYVKLTHLKMHQKTCRETLEKRLAKEKERNGFKIACDLCEKRFKNNSRLALHRHFVHKSIDRYACNLCDKKYKKMEYLNSHKDAVHLGKVLNCRFCKKGFRYKTNVSNHEKVCDQREKIKVESQEICPAGQNLVN